jgi:hypothetical protein
MLIGNDFTISKGILQDSFVDQFTAAKVISIFKTDPKLIPFG